MALLEDIFLGLRFCKVLQSAALFSTMITGIAMHSGIVISLNFGQKKVSNETVKLRYLLEQPLRQDLVYRCSSLLEKRYGEQ